MLKDAINDIQNGKIKRANQTLIKIIRENPNNPDAWYWLSRTFVDKVRKVKALKKALEIEPDFPQAIKALAELELAEFTKVSKPKKWYFDPAVKILAFIFFTPFWTLIVLDDPDSTAGVKILATILLIAYLLIACNILGVI